MAALISIILPVYNGIKYLKLSVDSVLSQTETNFEFLILDDCSTDSSYAYVESLNDARITLYKNENNKGLFYNLNFLIKESKTNLIKLWAQDDIMYPNCLNSFIAFHNKYPQVGFSYSGCTIIGGDGTIVNSNKIDNTPEIISTELHARIAFFTGSIAGNIANVCINKNALNEVGLFKENMKISADFDMWVRLAEKYETGFIKEPLIFLRNHNEQLSRNEDFYILHVQEDMIVYKYLLNYVPNNLKVEGKKLLRNNKFVFYYTLMLKTFFKGRYKMGILYYLQLSTVDNFFKISLSFFKAKFFRPKNPSFLNFPERI
jgi:glycosyltransferase involved in cell wall biosynthesis